MEKIHKHKAELAKMIADEVNEAFRERDGFRRFSEKDLLGKKDMDMYLYKPGDLKEPDSTSRFSDLLGFLRELLNRLFRQFDSAPPVPQKAPENDEKSGTQGEKKAVDLTANAIVGEIKSGVQDAKKIFDGASFHELIEEAAARYQKSRDAFVKAPAPPAQDIVAVYLDASRSLVTRIEAAYSSKEAIAVIKKIESDQSLFEAIESAREALRQSAEPAKLKKVDDVLKSRVFGEVEKERGTLERPVFASVPEVDGGKENSENYPVMRE